MTEPSHTDPAASNAALLAARDAAVACDLAPLRGNTFSVLALALLAQGRGEEAVEAASREPHSAFRNHALAIVHHTPWLEELDDSLERYLDLDPDAVEPARSIGDVPRDDDREVLATA